MAQILMIPEPAESILKSPTISLASILGLVATCLTGGLRPSPASRLFIMLVFVYESCDSTADA